MPKFYSDNPSNCIYIYEQSNGFNYHDCIRIQHTALYEEATVCMSPEEALEMANVLTKIAKQAIENNKDVIKDKIESSTRRHHICPSTNQVAF